MLRRHVAMMINAGRAGDAKKTRMLAGAVVMQRRRRAARASERLRGGLIAGPRGAAFQRRDVEPGPRQHALRDLDMRRFAAMTGAGQRQLLIAEAVALRRM